MGRRQWQQYKSKHIPVFIASGVNYFTPCTICRHNLGKNKNQTKKIKWMGTPWLWSNLLSNPPWVDIAEISWKLRLKNSVICYMLHCTRWYLHFQRSNLYVPNLTHLTLQNIIPLSVDFGGLSPKFFIVPKTHNMKFIILFFRAQFSGSIYIHTAAVTSTTTCFQSSLSSQCETLYLSHNDSLFPPPQVTSFCFLSLWILLL